MRSEGRPLSREILAALSQTSEVQASLRDTAKAIRRDASVLAPRNTGRLGKSLEIERVVDGQGTASYIVGWNKRGFYGVLVEFGAEANPPRPHLVPAAIKNGAVASRELGDGGA